MTTLPAQTWPCPNLPGTIPSTPSDDGYDYCSKPFMLVLSDIYPTFDSDQLPGSPFGRSLPRPSGTPAPALDVDVLADDIFLEEESAGNRFIGQQGITADGACTEKYVDGFGDIRGLCPEEPTKQGSYYAASVAWYGRNRGSCSAVDGDQNVRTYAVGLASPLPQINIQLMGRTITLVPFAKSVGGCSISADPGRLSAHQHHRGLFCGGAAAHLRQVPDQLRRRGAGRRP